MAQTSKKKNETRSMPPVSPAREAFANRKENFGEADTGAAAYQTEALFTNRGTSPARGTSSARGGAAASKGASAAVRKPLQKRATPDYTNIRNQHETSAQKRKYGALKVGAGSAAMPAGVSRVRKKIKRGREKSSKFDIPFFTIVIVLLAFGIVMMFSASYAFAYRTFGDSYHFAANQLRFIALGMGALLILSVIDYHIMMKKFVVIIGASVAAGLMLLVKVTGTTQGGAERWLSVGSITIQPSEILKFAVIVVFAYFAHTKYDRLRELKRGFLPFLVFLLFSCGLTLMQPHLSGTIIIFLIGLIMMFVGDCKVKHIVVTIVLFAVFAVIGLTLLNAIGYDYFSDRILSWQDPEADVRGATFQTYQSLVTIGSGGVFGLGLGNSRQKYAYLPASHNDFIFSIICEELGFVGAVLVILLFILFVFRGFYIAVRARDKFGMLLAAGITAQLGIQALLNIAVVTNSIPNTGISLPFFSYGGSALVMQLAEIGVLLNISRKAAIE